MASVGSYEVDYTGDRRPVVHTNPTLYRRIGMNKEDIGKYGYQQKPGGMRTVNTVNMIKSKDNITTPRDRQDRKGRTYVQDPQDYSPKGLKMSDSPSNRNQEGVSSTQRKPHYDRFHQPKQTAGNTTNSQPQSRRMNDHRGLVPVKELRNSVTELTPRLQLNGSQSKIPPTNYQSEKSERTTESQDGLSTNTKLHVLTRNRQLVYVETVWTKKRLEKLRASGFGDHTLSKKLKSTKEEKRWDTIMREVQKEPATVHTLWEYIRIEYPNVFSVLYKEYQTIVRNHFKPRISNLQTTPANANKMLDILVEQSEEYDQRMYKLQRSLQDQEDMLEDIRQVVDETRRVVFEWGGREIPEVDQQEEGEDLKEISQQVLDTVVVVSQEKEQLMEQQRTANEELRKKVAKMNRAAKKEI